MAEPSAILADALNGVTQATFKALRAYEQRSRKGVGEKEREIEDVSAERDEAVEDAARLRKQQTVLMKELEQLKAELERMDLAHSHQTQLVDSLREESRQWKQEAEQWKQQCLRIEENSRQQIADWRDHYLRADQDRKRAEAEYTRTQGRLEKALSSSDPFTSSHRAGASANTTLTASTSRNINVTARGSTDKPTITPISPLLPTPSTHNPTPGPTQTLIRRVSTTFTLDPGVKTEEESDNERLTPPTPTASTGKLRKSGAASTSKAAVRDESGQDQEGDDVRRKYMKRRPAGSNPKPDASKTAHVQPSRRVQRRPEPYLESDPDEDGADFSPLKVRTKYTIPRKNNVARERPSDDEALDVDDDELDMVSDEGASRSIRADPKASSKNGVSRRGAEPASSRKRKIPPDASATPAATPGRAKKQR